MLARELSALRIPAAAVLGNHDLESGRSGEVRQILTDAGLIVLDGDACELQGIGIAGVKGFGGGFGRHALGPWGETIIKQFVHEAVDEALKLEAAFARLRTAQLIALLHYAPIQADRQPAEPAERRLLRHAAVAPAVPARHRPLEVPRRAPAAGRADDGGATPHLDGRDHQELVARVSVRPAHYRVRRKAMSCSRSAG